MVRIAHACVAAFAVLWVGACASVTPTYVDGDVAPSSAGAAGWPSSQMADSERQAAIAALIGQPVPQALNSFRAYCEEHLPNKISATRQIAGYLDERGEHNLGTAYSRFNTISGKFRYLDLKLNDRTRLPRVASGTVGRFSLANPGDPGCALLDAALPKDARRNQLPNIPADKCVSLQLAPKSDSDAVIRFKTGPKVVVDNLRIEFGGTDYLDNRTGERLGGNANVRFDLSDRAGISVLLSCSTLQANELDIIQPLN